MSGRGAPAEDVDLTVDQQRRIEHLFAQLPGLGHYELLGVVRTADKKEIQRAYHERVMELHPDRFWGKRLGTFKPKMEAIVGN